MVDDKAANARQAVCRGWSVHRQSRFADTMKDRGFIQSITSGEVPYQIADGVATARSCMLAVMAAEAGRQVTWDELQTEQRSLFAWWTSNSSHRASMFA